MPVETHLSRWRLTLIAEKRCELYELDAPVPEFISFRTSLKATQTYLINSESHGVLNLTYYLA